MVQFPQVIAKLPGYGQRVVVNLPLRRFDRYALPVHPHSNNRNGKLVFVSGLLRPFKLRYEFPLAFQFLCLLLNRLKAFRLTAQEKAIRPNLLIKAKSIGDYVRPLLSRNLPNNLPIRFPTVIYPSFMPRIVV